MQVIDHQKLDNFISVSLGLRFCVEGLQDYIIDTIEKVELQVRSVEKFKQIDALSTVVVDMGAHSKKGVLFALCGKRNYVNYAVHKDIRTILIARI